MRDKNPRNPYKVPKKVWTRWTVVGKHVFNKTYEYMTKDPEIFMHPETIARGLPDKEFETIAWNSSWIAADVASRGEKNLLDILVKEIRGAE